MGSTRDFVSATVADALLPVVRRPVEDVIYETLDRRQVPNRSDFKELRDLVNSLRGQMAGATGGVQKLADSIEDIEETISTLEERMSGMQARLDALSAAPAPLTVDALDARLADLKAEMLAAQPTTSVPATTTGSAASAQAVAAAESCKVEDCDSKVRARGYCARHYQKWRRGTLDQD